MIYRYLRLYLYFLRFSFSKAAEFRFDFLFRIFMDFLYYGAHFAFFSILFRHSESIGGWTHPQMNIFLGTVFVVDAIQMTIFSNNLWTFSMSINKGDFDYHLLRPISPLFMMSLRDVAINSAVNLVGAVGILAYFIHVAPFEFGAAKLFAYSLMIMGGVLTTYFLRMLFTLPVFWTQAPRGFENLYFGLSQTSERPDRIYTGWVRRIITTVLPYAMFYSYPARVLLDEWSWPVIGHMVLVLAIFGLVVKLIWSRALRIYASASS